jgi:hypothetical protein
MEQPELDFKKASEEIPWNTLKYCDFLRPACINPNCPYPHSYVSYCEDKHIVKEEESTIDNTISEQEDETLLQSVMDDSLNVLAIDLWQKEIKENAVRNL